MEFSFLIFTRWPFNCIFFLQDQMPSKYTTAPLELWIRWAGKSLVPSHNAIRWICHQSMSDGTRDSHSVQTDLCISSVKCYFTFSQHFWQIQLWNWLDRSPCRYIMIGLVINWSECIWGIRVHATIQSNNQLQAGNVIRELIRIWVRVRESINLLTENSQKISPYPNINYWLRQFSVKCYFEWVNKTFEFLSNQREKKTNFNFLATRQISDLIPPNNFTLY